MWPDGTHSMLIDESSCVCMPSFRSVDPIHFFLGVKVQFLAFFLYRK